MTSTGDQEEANRATGSRVQPLSGVTVLDATHVLAGPFATYQLALLGAGVVRVERPDGDDFIRRHGGTEEMKALGLGASFLSQNACKRSVGINLKDPRGSELFRRLARAADVVIENFRPGVVERLGIGFAAIAAVNPRIVYCSLSGYGPTGPLAGAPAYDHIIQGISGMMAMTGTPESGPLRVGFPIVDYVAGQTTALAILAGLMHRDRHRAGAQHLQVPMLDSVVSFMAASVVDLETTGNLRGLQGNEAFSNSPFSDRFDTADGQIVVTANTPAQACRLCNAIGRPDLKAFVARQKAGLAVEQRDEIILALREAFAGASAYDWEKRLAAAEVPAAKVRTLAEVVGHPQVAQSELMRELEVPDIGRTLRVPGSPIRSDSWAPRKLAAPPTLGRDTEAVLRASGMSASEISLLRSEKVIA